MSIHSCLSFQREYHDWSKALLEQNSTEVNIIQPCNTNMDTWAELSFVFDWLDHVLKPCRGPAEVHQWPHEGLQALPPAGCSGEHPGVFLNKWGVSNVNLRMLQSTVLSICTFPHSSGSLSLFLPISSDSSGLSLVCALPSPAFTPRTIQFCRTSIGCLCPEKSNCSTEEKKTWDTKFWFKSEVYT